MPWKVTRDDADVLIAGPGGLEITLQDFDPGRVERDELPPEVLGSLLQLDPRGLGASRR